MKFFHTLRSIATTAGVATALLGSVGLQAQCPADDDAGTNDTCATAQAIATGPSTGYSVLSGGADDYYTFTVPAGSVATVNVLFIDAIADVDARLFDDAGSCLNQVASGSSVTDNETLVATNWCTSPVTYTLRVFIFSGTCNDYSLDIVTSSAGPGCGVSDDAFEDNDTAGTATPLALPASSIGLVSVACDEDWYAINVGSGNDLTIDLTFLDVNGNINAYLWDSTVTTSLDTGVTGTDNEQVTWTNLTGSTATVLLQVRNLEGPCNTYDIAAVEAPSPCAGPDDAQEQNDDCLNAVVPSGNPLTGLFVHKSDPDFYDITVGPNEILDVNVLFIDAVADVDAQLIDQSNCTTLLDTSASTTDNEDLHWTNPNAVATNVTLRVYVFASSTGDCNTYDLNWASNPDPCVVNPDDSFEQNDTCTAAVSIPGGTTPNLFVRKQNTDEDWYVTNVAAGGTLTVDALFTHANGDVDLRIFDTCGGTQLDASTGVVDNEQVTWTNTGAVSASVLIEVYVWNSSTSDCNTYDLVVTGGTGGPPNLVSSCFGDGGDQLGCTNCICGNNATIGSMGGCLNSSGTSARLVASGSPDVTTPADTLHFNVMSANVSTFGILTSGSVQLPNNPANVCFAQNPGSGVVSALLDGLRCVGGTVIRHGSRATDSNGNIGITNNGWGPPNNPIAGLGVASGFVAGQTRHFQVFYRENSALVCMTGQNTTQAVSVTFL